MELTGYRAPLARRDRRRQPLPELVDPVQECSRMRGGGGHDITAEPGSPRSRAASAATGVVMVLVMLGASALVGWMFLERYRDPNTAAAAAGSDTAHHQWRIEVVTDAGLAALPTVDARAQALNTNADRPGLPIAGAVASATGIAEPRELVYVLPALMAVISRTHSGRLRSRGDGSNGFALPAYLVGVGASVQVALTANGYFDQLLVMPLLLGAGTCVVAAATDRRVYPCALLLFGAAFAVHWQFAVAFTLLLSLVPLGMTATSLREHRAGAGWWSLPAVASAVTAGGGLVVGALALAGVAPLRTPLGLTHDGIAGNIARQLPRYRFPVPAITALGGAAALWTRPRARPSLWLLVPWASVPAVAAIVFAAGVDVPVQRALTFALALPILWVALMETVARAGARAAGGTGGRRGRIVAVLLVAGMAGAVAWSAGAGYGTWRSRPTPMSNEQFAQMQATARYLDAAGGTAVVVVDVPESGGGAPGRDFGSVPAIRRLRAQLDADPISTSASTVADPTRLLRTERDPAPRRARVRRDVAGAVDLGAAAARADPAIIVLRPSLSGVGPTRARPPLVEGDRLARHRSWPRADRRCVGAGRASRTERRLARGEGRADPARCRGHGARLGVGLGSGRPARPQLPRPAGGRPRSDRARRAGSASDSAPRQAHGEARRCRRRTRRMGRRRLPCGQGSSSSRWCCRSWSRRSTSRPAASSSRTSSRAARRGPSPSGFARARSARIGPAARPPASTASSSPRASPSSPPPRPAPSLVRSSIERIPSASRCLGRQVVERQPAEHVVHDRGREPDVGVVRHARSARTSC